MTNDARQGGGGRHRRLTEIFTRLTPDSPRASFGSGFLLGNGIVLTARHVLFPRMWESETSSQISISARPLALAKTEDLRPAELVWPIDKAELENRNAPDVALIRIINCPDIDGRRIFLGLGEAEEQSTINMHAAGFPDFKCVDGLREVDQITGRIPTLTGARSGVYEITALKMDGERDLDTTLKWAGISGSPVFSDPYRIIGVLITREDKGRFDFQAVRLEELLQREEFVSALSNCVELDKHTWNSSARTASPLKGWEYISKEYLAGLPQLSPEETGRYFDGAIPTWRHAISPSIPKRGFVGKLVALINQKYGPSPDCLIQVVTAAAGEGKSTLILQVAAALSHADWNVLWRPRPRVELDLENLTKLDISARWLVVADEAENLVTDMDAAARELHDIGRRNIMFLLAARDTDWRFAKGREKNWSSKLVVLPEILLRGIGPDDALLVVDAWDKLGVAGLRKLGSISSREGRAHALIAASHQDGEGRSDGSFYGGLLATRFDEESLRAHAIDMMDRLRGISLFSGYTLLHALVYVSAAHAAGIPGLHQAVLAELVKAPADWVHSHVIRPMGEEAAVTETANYVLTRHRRVASIIIAEAELRFGFDLVEVWTALLRATIDLRGMFAADDRSYRRTVHAAPRLPRELKSLTKKRRVQIALAAAETARQMLPDRLDCLVDLATVYRLAKMTTEARKIFREYQPISDRMEDFIFSVRGFWYEWGVCEGFVDNFAIAACLQGISLSDRLAAAEFKLQRVAISCAGLAMAFSKVVSRSEDGAVFPAARCAVAFIGLKADPDDYTYNLLKEHASECERLGISSPGTLIRAIDALTVALMRCQSRLTDEYFRETILMSDFKFSELAKYMDKIVPQSP